MAYKYLEINEPDYKASSQRLGLDFVLVQPTDTSKVPVTLPNWQPEPCCLYRKYEAYGEKIKQFEVRPDDVWLASFPRSGTTWCQEMIWLICNDLDFGTAESTPRVKRIPFLERQSMPNVPSGDPYEDLMSMSTKRFIKTHLPVAFLPDQIWTVKPKLVYVRRNPKSVAVSYYHHSVSLENYKGSMEDFIGFFMKDLQHYSPYHSHVMEFHSLEYGDNLLLLCYEDMKKDLRGVLHKVCKFFNKAYSEEQLDTLEEYLSFESMKNNKSVNFRGFLESQLRGTNRLDKLNDTDYQFIRRGESEGWRSELSDDTVQKLNEWTKCKVTDPEQLKLF